MYLYEIKERWSRKRFHVEQRIINQKNNEEMTTHNQETGNFTDYNTVKKVEFSYIELNLIYKHTAQAVKRIQKQIEKEKLKKPATWRTMEVIEMEREVSQLTKIINAIMRKFTDSNED